MKHKIIILTFLLIMSLSACTKNTNSSTSSLEKITALSSTQLSSEYLNWFGRYHLKNGQAYYYHTATGFEISIYGRIVQIELQLEAKVNDIYYTIVKDDENVLDSEVCIQTKPSQTFTITFDDYNHHKMQIIKRSEPEDGITSLVRLSTNGEFLPIKPVEKPHFLIIGASGISGHGALGNPGEPRTTANSSSLHSFGFLTAMHYDGTFEFVSSSGWGLKYGYNNRQGNDNLAKAYDYVGITSNGHIIYDTYLNKKIPDYFIINMGGNDYSAVINQATGFDKTEKINAFKSAVASFILKLREEAPSAHIIWTMTKGSLNGTSASQVIQQLDEKDKVYVHVAIIKQVGEDGDLAGADNHASFITHQKSAQNIIDLIDNLSIV